MYKHLTENNMKDIIIKYLLKLPYCVCLGIFIYSCSNKNDLHSLSLKKINKLSEKGILIDTLFNCKQKSIYILQIDKPHGIDDYNRYFALVKDLEQSSKLIYVMDNIAPNMNAIVSREYFSLIDWRKPYPGWGWFYMKNNKLENELPLMDNILDTIGSHGQCFLLKETNGYISYFSSEKMNKESKIELNYGAFVLKNQISLDSLNYGLYKLNAANLELISNHGDDLLKQKDGVFYIPSPGYDVVTKFKISKLVHIIDSTAKQTVFPQRINMSN